MSIHGNEVAADHRIVIPVFSYIFARKEQIGASDEQ